MTLRQDILDYLNTEIIPQYTGFDKAHDINHVSKVIKSSLALAEELGADTEIAYVVAAYHDIGLANGRENHEKASAVYLLSDKQLQLWFAQDVIDMMAEAVEDHRASTDHEPRSIYGKIVAEADRDIDYQTILKRILLYSLEHYPEYTATRHWERCISHLKEKYSESGYIKLWLDIGPNRRNLTEMQAIMRDENRVREDFMRLYRGHSQLNIHT